MMASAIKKKMCKKEKPSEYVTEQIADYIARYCDHAVITNIIDLNRYGKLTIYEALVNTILNDWENRFYCNTLLINNLDKIIQKGIFHEIILLLSDFDNQIKCISILIYSIVFWFIRYHYDSPYAIIVIIAYTIFVLFIIFYF